MDARELRQLQCRIEHLKAMNNYYSLTLAEKNSRLVRGPRVAPLLSIEEKVCWEVARKTTPLHPVSRVSRPKITWEVPTKGAPVRKARAPQTPYIPLMR